MAITVKKMEYGIMHWENVAVDAPIGLGLQSDQRQSDQRQSDQRQTQRREINQPAIVTVLGTAGQIFHGEVRNVSEGGTQILLGQPVGYGSLVTIDHDDNRLLGEVVYCQKEQAGWLVGVRIEHALFGLATLPSLREWN
ncbi:MAG: PilZ domain-containing protein [Acidobacteriota bacterium]|nr:PilZ domain-containing protein [Acidobacteriota bacterium]